MKLKSSEESSSDEDDTDFLRDSDSFNTDSMGSEEATAHLQKLKKRFEKQEKHGLKNKSENSKTIADESL